VADIGLQGSTLRSRDSSGASTGKIEAYEIYLRGSLGEGAAIGRPIVRRVPQTEAKFFVERLVGSYLDKRLPEESFRDFADRQSDEELIATASARPVGPSGFDAASSSTARLSSARSCAKPGSGCASGTSTTSTPAMSMPSRSRCTTSLGSCRLGSGPAGSVLPSSYGMHAHCVGMLCCIMHDTQPLAAEEKHTALGLPSEGSSALHRGRFLCLRTPLHPPVMHVPRACLLLEHGNSLGELCESFASQWRPRKCPRL